MTRTTRLVMAGFPRSLPRVAVIGGIARYGAGGGGGGGLRSSRLTTAAGRQSVTGGGGGELLGGCHWQAWARAPLNRVAPARTPRRRNCRRERKERWGNAITCGARVG